MVWKLFGFDGGNLLDLLPLGGGGGDYEAEPQREDDAQGDGGGGQPAGHSHLGVKTRDPVRPAPATYTGSTRRINLGSDLRRYKYSQLKFGFWPCWHN